MKTQLSAITKLLRTNALSDLDAFVVAIALFGWAKLSVTSRLSANSAMQRILEGGLAAQEQTLLSAANEHRDGLLSDLLKLQGVNGDVVQTLVSLTYEFVTSGDVDKLPMAELLPNHRDAPLALPKELVTLMVQLGQFLPNERVYTPWDFYGQLAVASHRLGVFPFIETPIHSSLPRLLQLLADTSSPVQYSDPIIAPSAVADGELIKFDVALSIPPIGLRYERQISQSDRWHRFPEHTTSGAVLAVRHLLAQTKRRVIALVPNSLLSNSGSEAAFRQDLLQRGLVEAVIAFPKGLFEATSVATALLILDPSGRHDKVNFVDVGESRFCNPISKARWRLADPEGLAEIALSSHELADQCVITVSRKEVLANDATLQVNRYMAKRRATPLRHKPAVQQSVSLSEVVHTVRPLPATARKDAPLSNYSTSLHEVGAIDLPSHGYITRPERLISVDKTTLDSAAPLFLRPLDIVLIVKGGVGKVGIIPFNIPAPGPGGWIVGQSGIVLRVNDPQRVDPRALFLRLRSPLGQLQLRGIVAGSTTPLIQLRELIALTIQLPSREEEVEAIEALETEMNIQEQIDQLRTQQAMAAAHLWSFEGTEQR